MTAKVSQRSTRGPAQDSNNHDLLLALSRAAQAVQQARRAEDVYRAVGEQIKALGHDAIILITSADDQNLKLSYTTFSNILIEAGMKLTGLTIQDFSFPIFPNSIYARIIKNRKGEFGRWSFEAIAEALPENLRPLAGQLASLLKIEQSVIAPLCAPNGKTLGTLTVASSSINEDDIPAIESFAAQVAISLNNIRLTQQLERELFERKEVEEALRISQSTFEGIFNSITEAVYILDENGSFLKVNSGAEKMYGYAPEYFVGRTPEFLSAPGRNDLAKVLELTYQAYLGQTVEFEFWGLRKDGSVFPKDVRLTPGTYFGKKVVIAVGRDITEHKNTEEAIRQTERHFKSLIENSTDGILVVNTEGKIHYESLSVARMLGYGTDALIGTSAFDLIHPDDLAQIAEAFMEGLQTPGYIHRGEYRLRHRTGAWRDFEIVSHYMMDDPVISGIIINGRDITERKQAEAELLESNLRYQRLTDNAPDIIFRYNLQPAMSLVYINPAVQLITGYTQAECYADPNLMFNMIHPDDLPVMANYMQSLQPPTEPMFMRWIGKDGIIRWMESRIVPIYDSTGQLIAVEGITRDITGRKLAEDALRESESKFHSVVSESADGVALTDETGRIIEFNNAFEKITGQKRETALGQYVWDLQFHMLASSAKTNEHYEEIKEAIQRVLETGSSQYLYKIMEVPFEHSDSSTRFIQQRLFSIRTEKGWRVGSISRDVTERKQVEEALHASEERYRVLYEDNPSMYFTSDSNGTVLSVNKFGVEELGYSAEELTGQPLFKVFHPDDQNSIQKQFTRCLQNLGQAIQIEARKIRKNGTTLWVRESACAVRDSRGQVVVLLICENITERKLAVEALYASEERSKSLYQMLRLMTDNLPDLIWAKDMNGRYLFANKAITEKLLVARDTEEPLGKTDLYFAERQRITHPQNSDWHTFGELCVDSDKIIHTYKRPQRFEEFGNVKGEFLFLDVYKAPFLDEQGNMIGTVGVGRDVTHERKLEEERKRTQAALAASEAELRALFASMQDTVLVLDRDGVYCRIAPTHNTKFYISPEKVIGKNLMDFFPAEQAATLLMVIQQVLETKQTVEVEYELNLNDQAIWFETSISAMSPDQTLWVARDISERKKIEAALARSEQAYRKLFENMPIGLYRTSVDGQILDANTALVRMFGYPDQNSFLKTKVSELYVDPQADASFKEKISTKKTLAGFEAEFCRKDKTTFWGEDHVRIVYDQTGSPLFFEGSLIDISERKQAEDELRRANKSLETAHRELQQMLEHEQVLARTDSLTGLYNRRYFFELATREFNAALRYQRPLTIVLFDVDNFKQINDNLGHAIGDAVLAQVAQVTAAQVRDVDVLARYGGDEFIILLPETNSQAAFHIAERVRLGVAAIRVTTENEPLTVTLSIGIAETIHTSQDKSIEEVIHRADQTLYKSKKNGRNQTSLFTESL